MFKSNLSGELQKHPKVRLIKIIQAHVSSANTPLLLKIKLVSYLPAPRDILWRFKYKVTLSSKPWFFWEEVHFLYSDVCSNLWQIYISEHLFLHILFLSVYRKNKHDLFLLSCIRYFGLGMYVEWESSNILYV